MGTKWGFMKPEVYKGKYFEVETNVGTEIVPAEVLDRGVTAVFVEDLYDYLEGDPNDPNELCAAKDGWLARLQAPGYLDCTSWSAHKTEKEALDYLEEMYGDEGEDE